MTDLWYIVAEIQVLFMEGDSESDIEQYWESENDGNSNGSDDSDDFVMPVADNANDSREEEYQQLEVLTTGDVSNYMQSIVRQITSILQLPEVTIRMLLNHFHWDKEKLMERFYDSPDPHKLFEEAGIADPRVTDTPKSDKPGTSVTTGSSDKLMCEICLHTFTYFGMIGLQCKHFYCTRCWTQYLTSKIMDEGVSQGIKCAGFPCNVLVDDSTIMKLVREERVRARYNYLIVKTFIECSRTFRWCPAPNCEYVIRVFNLDVRKVKCKCGYLFCFDCGEEWHDPISCEMLAKWLKKCTDDNETSNWLAANTKECPKCHVVIHKDGGCNHMTCRNVCCKNEFCWVCLGPWEPHGSSWYSCNRYDDEAAKAARNAQEISRSDLQRYVHFYKRFSNHTLSLKLEKKLYNSVKVKMNEMQMQNMSWVEVQFLRKAVDVLCDCRRTLKHTYAFAFYLEKNNQSIIFEDNQNDLELATEQLSEFLEQDLASTNFSSLKQLVQDKYRYCENRRKALLNHCQEGNEKNWWVFND
ncbi:protein ariadne-1 [Trichinella spiralis]|uniref:RBR-type E3 ubiquitin transferase n=1 Tax=Trichinella spiralis TaxID=6334 RepID=E5SHS0_TRISP|nr:protein ariadne-1 [Trichinella spiralis]KRY35967.1 E3 ubiquitin-protein ligase arih1l [Trichinella spiralis]